MGRRTKYRRRNRLKKCSSCAEKAVEVAERAVEDLDDPGLEGCRDRGCTIGEDDAVVSAIGGEDIVTVALDVGDESVE